MTDIPNTIHAQADQLRIIANSFRNSNIFDTRVLFKAADELERLTEKANSQANVLRRLNPENFPDTFFISGESGTRDENGLPEYVHIVPAYGLDWHMMYKRTDKTWGPQW